MDIITVSLLVFVGYSSVQHFGWVNGLSVVFVVYLLMPWAPGRHR